MKRAAHGSVAERPGRADDRPGRAIAASGGGETRAPVFRFREAASDL